MLAITSCAEAKALGLKRYFTGEPCKNGHVAERYTSGWRCIVCSSEKSASAYARNPDQKRENNARYQAENPDKVRQSKARYRRENPDKMRQYKARHRAKHPDGVRKSK